MKAKELRKKAWDALKGRYWWAVLAALIAWLFGAISIATSSGATSQGQEAISNGGDVAATTSTQISGFVEKLPANGTVLFFIILIGALLIAIAMTVISSAIRLGYCRFNIDLFTEVEKPGMNILFSRMKLIWKALWLDILKGLIITLGMIILFVPGIIFALSLSQTSYILAENPDMKAGDVLKKSRELMKNNKWRLLCLDLSFIGWIILSAFVPAGALLLTPYTEAADAAFYLDITGRLSDGAKDLSEMESKA